MRLSVWARAVKERDNYTCQKCGITADEIGTRHIHAHHIRPRALGGKNTLSNGTTLCLEHHKEHHKGMYSPYKLRRTPRARGVRAEIARKGVKYNELARRLGERPETINKWFRGVEEPPLKNFIQLLVAAGMSVEEILSMHLRDFA